MINLNLKKDIDFWIGGLSLVLLYPFVRLVGVLLKRDHQLANPKHIVFIKMLGGGSLSMLYPCVLALRKKYPDLKISLICNRSITHFAKSFQLFDEIQVIQDQSALQLLKSGFGILFWLMKSADVTVDLEVHSRLTTVLTTTALVKNRVGLINMNSLWRKRLYTHSVYVNSVKNLSEVYDSILGLFGIEDVNVSLSREKIRSQLVGKSFSLNGYNANSDVLVSLGIGCSDLALERQMPDDLWTSLIQSLLQKNPKLFFCFLGGKEDQVIASRLKSKLLPAFQDRVGSLCGQVDIMTSLKVISQSSLFFGIDSALIHLSRLIGTSSVSFWGPTSPESLLRPLPVQDWIVTKNVHCSPCVHFTETPPCHGQNFCMNHSLRIPSLVSEISAFLENSSTAKPFLTKENKSTGVWTFYPDETQPRMITMKVQYA